MKALFVLLMLVYSAGIWACDKKVDSSKVVLFLDANSSDPEIETAEKAACERGERLVVVPKNYKDYRKYIDKMDVPQKKFIKCGANKETPKCKEIGAEIMQTVLEYFAYKDKQPSLNDRMKEALSEIKQSNGKVQSFIISGHDGGGSFGGHKGSVTRETLTELMNQFKDINEAKSVLLLGCYTGTQHEVMQWKNIFPQAKMIAGYDGSAPFSEKPIGHRFLSDLLIKEKDLSSQADDKKLQSYVSSNFKEIENLSAAIYLKCSDGTSMQEYYYGSKKSRKFEKMSAEDCIQKKKELEDIRATLEKYDSGSIEPPKDTRNGALRALYNRGRTNEHCGEITGVNIDMNRLFNLLFHDGVKASFSSYYKDELEEAGKIIANLDAKKMEQNVQNNIAIFEKNLKEKEALTLMLEKNPTAYFALREKELNQLKIDIDKLKNDPAYARVKKMVNDNATPQFPPAGTSETDKTKFQELRLAIFKYNDKSKSISEEKANPRNALAARKQDMEINKNIISQLNAGLVEMKKPENKIWVPNSENLKKYSRKDLLKNIHNMNRILTNSGASGKEEGALRWLSGVTQDHLQTFTNPFNWHEYTGKKVDPPVKPLRLKEYLK